MTEGQRCEGKNRWNPSVSEYAEPEEGGEEYTTTAKSLLGTKLSTQTAQNLAEVSHYLQTSKHPPLLADKSRLAAKNARLSRPQTRERFGGKRALVNIHQRTISRFSTPDEAATPSTEKAMQDPLLLRVQMGPHRSRNNISFKKKDLRTGGQDSDAGSAPKLVMFEHFQGSRVYRDLFPEFHLPNGKTTHYYYTMGALVEEAEVCVGGWVGGWVGV
jgi:hypothetical protein